ncbi:cell division protein FtsQ/DivIB [Limoniibacter endophyticus]|uniref:Cell division protein FtsQ n=1 Tax=Limoniibacter endophyticus TaxID=1565040 RepID=A0A8J3GI01_9HYPH|nr:cell division protein FtsQ/DivIB [Limoniibacter endophyticus]GHC75217.1 cell division protein FtsQ [Limoniibacter endophyticus]
MFALKSQRTDFDRRVSRADYDRRGFLDGYVLPRWLRKPVRLAARLFDDDFQAPRFAMTIASVGLFAASAMYGTAAGGHTPAVLQAITANAGFAIEQVRVNGQKEISEIDIVGALELDGSTSLIGFDAFAARARVAALPWVESVEIRKVYPGQVDVNLVERKPFALLQKDGDLSVIEEDGRVIAPLTNMAHLDLPLLVGAGADMRASQFIGEMAAHPDLASQVKAYIRVADRRWDLMLKNGVTLRLPEDGMEAAIDKVLRADREQGLFGKDILAVDLRQSDRMVLKMSPEAVEQRAEAFKERAKRMRAEHRI